jgi:hypothetical protein
MSQERDSPFHVRCATPSDNRRLAELGAETFCDSFAVENTPENGWPMSGRRSRAAPLACWTQSAFGG